MSDVVSNPSLLVYIGLWSLFIESLLTLYKLRNWGSESYSGHYTLTRWLRITCGFLTLYALWVSRHISWITPTKFFACFLFCLGIMIQPKFKIKFLVELNTYRHTFWNGYFSLFSIFASLIFATFTPLAYFNIVFRFALFSGQI